MQKRTIGIRDLFSSKRLIAIGIMVLVLFLLSGGFSAISSYLFGASSYSEYRMSTLAPLFGGAVMMGAFGLLFAYKNRNSVMCLLGLLITVSCYGFIEYLFQASGGI